MEGSQGNMRIGGSWWHEPGSRSGGAVKSQDCLFST